MATKEEIDAAFDNAVLLPVIYTDEPEVVQEDRMFLCSDLSMEDTEDDPRDADVFWYANADDDEDSLREQFAKGKDSSLGWYIPTPEEVEALNARESGAVDLDTVLPLTHKFLNPVGKSNRVFSKSMRGLATPRMVFEHLRYLVQESDSLFRRMGAKGRWGATERQCREHRAELLGMVDAAYLWGLLTVGEQEALRDRVYRNFAVHSNALKASGRAERKSKGGAK